MSILFIKRFWVIALFTIIALAVINSPRPVEGIASWYEAGEDWTCACRYFKQGAYVRVRNLRNDKEVICKVNDIGPHKELGRVIDLSRKAFAHIADLEEGLVPVRITQTAG